MSDSSPALSHISVARPSSSSGDDLDSDESSSHSEYNDGSVRATVRGNGLLIVSGLRTPSKRSRTSPTMLPLPNIDVKPWSVDDTANATNDGSAEESVEEPNGRGLYSKSYVQQHPEISWVHRGQGMYMRQSDLLIVKASTTPTKRSADESSFDDQQSVRSSKRQRSSNILAVGQAWETRSSTRTQSPQDTRKPDTAASYALRRRTSEYEPTASELRAARMLRRTGPGDQLSATQQSRDADDQDQIKTFSRTYVDAHPELKFKHCGNGFYRRDVMQSQSSQDSQNSRRDSDHSASKLENDSFSARHQQTIHASERKKYPGEKFTHCGNGYYRRASATSQPTTTASSNTTGSDDGIDKVSGNSFSKTQMLEYKERYPEAVFLHRGNGRYKRMDDVVIEAEQEAEFDPEDHVTYGKAYVDSHPEMDFYHCGGGRYKRGIRPSHTQIRTNGVDNDAVPLGLVNKKYVDNHPELVFHHRGQGRWALGARREESVVSSDSAMKPEKDTLYDRDYVDKHPDETFHHRGQGRWARGLPPPGSSSKMAVRGPGTKLVKTNSSSSSGSRSDKRPDPSVLYRKDEGPAKWPELDWTYRGGGKWILSGKVVTPSQRTSTQSNEPSGVSAEQDARSEVDSLASASRRTSLNGLDIIKPPLKRKRSALQAIEALEAAETSAAARSHSASPRRRQRLTVEEDMLTDADLPELYLDEWSQLEPDDTDDEAAQLIRAKFQPLNDAEPFVRAMTKYDPAIRPTETLYRLAEHMQHALRRMQDEYLELDKITAPHARIPRKLATGGRLPVEHLVHEDRKEADLYNYTFDPKKIGFQDPVAQRIIVDVDVRGLRKRRRRNEADNEAGAQLSEEASLGRRVPKPVHRFDGNPAPQSRRPRSVMGARGSATPDPMVTPEKRLDAHALADNFVAPLSGRWANHVPKRIRELRGDSVGPGRAADGVTDAEGSPVIVEGDDYSTDGDTPRKPGVRVVHSIEDAEDAVLASDIGD